MSTASPKTSPVTALASMGLTVFLLILSIVLVFAATLDQVHLGVWGVQEKYFRAFWVMSPIRGTVLTLPIFPGGYTLGILLLINLVAAHLTRFRTAWRQSGIWLTHVGLILLLAGEGLSGLLQQDNQMRLDVGQTRNYSESFRETELAITDTTAPSFDQVVAIPAGLLHPGKVIQSPSLPFTVATAAYYPNAMLRPRDQAPNAPAMATAGDEAGVAVLPLPETTKPDEANWPTAYVTLGAPDGGPGTFLVSTMLQGAQTFSYAGKSWKIALRPRRDYLPFSVTLEEFTHAVYPGTDIPKDFASTVRIRSDDGREDRRVRIFMNNPLRAAGRAFYQAGFANNDRTTVLQVVRNPSWQLPYVACSLIALGLVVQFGIHLYGFLFRRRAAAEAPASAAAPSVAERSWLPLGAVLAAVLGVGSTLAPHGPVHGYDLPAFGRLPVLSDGRVKPLDTLARTTLLMVQGRQRVTVENRTLDPEEWLLDVLFRPDEADGYKVFRIDNSDVLSLFGLSTSDGGQVRFSFAQLAPGVAELDRQAQLAAQVESAERSSFQRAVLDLHAHLDAYSRLKFTLESPDGMDLDADLRDPAKLAAEKTRAQSLDEFARIRAIPTASGWKTAGREIQDEIAGASPNASLAAYAALAKAWRTQDPAEFNRQVAALSSDYASRLAPEVHRASSEALFNQAAPFYTALTLYVVAFLLAVVSWLRWPGVLGRTALYLMGVAFVVATAGILTRMWLEQRPPVTNLYSSALFIGWGAVGLCLILERIHRNAIASAAGSLIGFGTLVIAHNLSLSGDTLEMMRAVLDSNFWLATHVVTVTAGYASTFLAGVLAAIYILRGVLTRSLDTRTADSLARMVYGIVCFATFFSFIGTVLGGIWADQSWGRFWGWDPKENGALIIVIWNAVILHCRWGGLVRQRGLMTLAVFGNVVTAWSWFGTNMLGVGLHSYGFTDAAFQGLVAFVVLWMAVIGLSAVNPVRWRSAERLAGR
jgi:ABC-type transport system involved in cytochrome c biogenesis permease subunit